MKAISLIQKAKSNKYFLEFDRLCSLDAKQHEAESRKKEYPKQVITARNKNGNIWDTQTKYNYILRSLKMQMIKYSEVYFFNCGIYSDIQADIYMQYSEYRNDERVILKVSFYLPKTSQRYTMQLPNNFNLKNTEPGLKKLLQTQLYTEGNIALIQYNKNITKEGAKSWFKIYLQKKCFFTYSEICHDKVQKWIEKNFNIESYFDLDKTIDIVNKLGKRAEKTIVQGIDLDFMQYFDGDIDEIEDEFYAANPIRENVIYI
jgi:hypothetical protein